MHGASVNNLWSANMQISAWHHPMQAKYVNKCI